MKLIASEISEKNVSQSEQKNCGSSSAPTAPINHNKKIPPSGDLVFLCSVFFQPSKFAGFSTECRVASQALVQACPEFCRFPAFPTKPYQPGAESEFFIVRQKRFFRSDLFCACRKFHYEINKHLVRFIGTIHSTEN